MNRAPITSSQNPKVKLIRQLTGRPRERREAEAFLVEGVRLVEEALVSNWPFRFVLHSNELGSRGQELLAQIRERGIEIDELSPRLLASLSDTETSQGILAVLVDEPEPRHIKPDFTLILDGIRDPGNLGTLLRAAEAAGVDEVMLAPGTVDPWSPKVVRSGMGAHFRQPFYEMGWDQLRVYPSVWHMNVYLADMRGPSCWETDLRAPLALIIGGEAEGASEDARRLATHTISIPMQGKVESLNAAVAGSVLMFEVRRQRGPRPPESR